MASTIHHYSKVSSTNDIAGELIKSGEITENCFVTADYQTDGKGRSGNRWLSEEGKNLLLSWIMFPAFLSVNRQFQLSKAVSLGITDFLSSLGLMAKIKWPNDILVENRKLAGILIENSIQGSSLKHAIAGIGMNINQLEFSEFPYQATSLGLETRKEYDVGQLIMELTERLNIRFKQLEKGEEELLDQEYLNVLFKKDQISDFKSNGHSFEGIIRGVNESGELVLEVKGKTKEYGFHEITMYY